MYLIHCSLIVGVSPPTKTCLYTLPTTCTFNVYIMCTLNMSAVAENVSGQSFHQFFRLPPSIFFLRPGPDIIKLSCCLSCFQLKKRHFKRCPEAVINHSWPPVWNQVLHWLQNFLLFCFKMAEFKPWIGNTFHWKSCSLSKMKYLF